MEHQDTVAFLRLSGCRNKARDLRMTSWWSLSLWFSHVRLGSKPLAAETSYRPWQSGFEERLNGAALAVHSPLGSRSALGDIESQCKYHKGELSPSRGLSRWNYKLQIGNARSENSSEARPGPIAEKTVSRQNHSGDRVPQNTLGRQSENRLSGCLFSVLWRGRLTLRKCLLLLRKHSS